MALRAMLNQILRKEEWGIRFNADTDSRARRTAIR
jgi:hypothetical protein